MYSERRAYGRTYTIGQWGDGSYTVAAREYPEGQPDGRQFYVWQWSDGSFSVQAREFAERRTDGSIWLTRQWSDGHYTGWPSSGLPANASVATQVPPAATTAPPPRRTALADLAMFLEGARLVASDGTYIGTLSSNPFSSDSICNDFGRYGNPFSSLSIKQEFAQYGNPFSSLSPYNEFSSQGPYVVSDGRVVARLTKNQFVSGAIDPDLALLALGCPRE